MFLFIIILKLLSHFNIIEEEGVIPFFCVFTETNTCFFLITSERLFFIIIVIFFLNFILLSFLQPYFIDLKIKRNSLQLLADHELCIGSSGKDAIHTKYF